LQGKEAYRHLEKPPKGGFSVVLGGASVDDAAAETNSDGMRTATGLQLREKVPNMALDGLLREKEANADLAVDKTIRDQLEHFDLARGRILACPLLRGLKRDDLRHGRIAPRRD